MRRAVRARMHAAAWLLASTGCSGAPPRAASDASAQQPRDAIVVLGHRPPLDAHGVEYETRARVDHGIALYRQGRAPWLVVSGGPSTAQAVEADVMARYASERGVPEARILKERASRDTIENARMSVALLRAALRLARAPRIVLVTSDYHIERATRLLRCAGADVEPAGVPLALSTRERRRRAWSERFVALYYVLIDECGRARL